MTATDLTSESALMRFRAGEHLAEAIDRVTDEQFDVALGIADSPAQDRALAVHSTRKSLKRLRAMLRLVRDVIPEDCYPTDNQVLKLIGLELSAVRDSWVMSQTLGRIVPHNPATDEALPELVARLESQYRATSRAVLDNEAQIVSIIEQLENAKKRSSRWVVLANSDAPLPHAFVSIRPGLERVYKRGRRGLHIVQGSPTDTLLHVWRKRAKYLRHQLEALNVLDPTRLQELEDRLERLTDLLGDDHDLAVLSARLTEDTSLRDGVDVDPVLAAIGHHRHELQAEAVELGATIYVDPTGKFISRLEKLWPAGTTF